MSYELPEAIAEVAQAEKQATRDELTRLDRGVITGATRYEIEFTHDPEDKGLGAIARFGADSPLPVPGVGQRVRLHGLGPLIVRRVDLSYDVNAEHGGLYIAATVDVALPEAGGAG